MKMVIPVSSRLWLHSLTSYALNHPKEKVVLARESDISVMNQAKRKKIAPGAGDKKWKLNRKGWKFDNSPLKS